MPVEAPVQPVTLSNEEILRYSRHLIMPEVGMEGQLKLKNAKVLLIGTGGLGAPLGLYLAAAGVGRLGLVDFDRPTRTASRHDGFRIVCRQLWAAARFYCLLVVDCGVALPVSVSLA